MSTWLYVLFGLNLVLGVANGLLAIKAFETVERARCIMLVVYDWLERIEKVRQRNDQQAI